MGKEEGVNVEKVSKVVPETRTKTRVMFMTSCDLVCRSYPYINRVFFYKRSEGSKYEDMVRVWQEGLAKTLVSFYPLAGRFSLADDARLQIDCCDAGVDFVEASCLLPFSLLSRDGFQYRSLFWHLARRTHLRRSDYFHESILSVQVTKFADDGITVGVSMSHAVADAQSFYDFVRCWADTCKGVAMSVPPTHMRMALTVKALLPSEDFSLCELQNCNGTKRKKEENADSQEEKMGNGDARDPKLEDELLSHLMASKELRNGDSLVVDELVKELQQMGLVGNPAVEAPSRTRAPIMEKQMEQEENRRPIADLVQKVFSFSQEMLQGLKDKANAGNNTGTAGTVPYSESICKGYEDVVGSPKTSPQSNYVSNGAKGGSRAGELPHYGFTTFEAFCAHWWQSLIRAKCLPPAQPVFLLIPINCRQRFLDIPKGYFGNALDGGLAKLTAGELCGAEIQVIAGKIHEAIKTATEESFRQYIKEAERKRNAIPHFDRTGLFHVVDSPKYPVYETDFGFGKPEAVRAEGFRFGAEVQVLAGRLGAGSYDLFCALDSATMHRLEHDPVFLAC